MRQKMFIVLLVLIFTLSSLVEIVPGSVSQEATIAAESGLSTEAAIDHYADRWAIVPKVEQAPDLDGVLDDEIWDGAVVLDDFVTAFYNEKAERKTDVKLAYDSEHLYFGLTYTYEDVAHSLANMELLISPYSTGESYYRIPISIQDLDLPFTNVWGPGGSLVNSHEYEVVQEEGVITAEVAVPISALNVDEVHNGDEWRINVINQHELNTHPVSSWVPIRTSSYTKTDTMSSIRFNIDVVNEGRMGSIFFNTLPKEWAPESYNSIWEPTELELRYTGFTEKELSFKAAGINHNTDRIHLSWKTPSGEQVDIENLELERVRDRIMVSFEHPAADDNGLYQLYVSLDQQRNKPEAMFTILSFDRNSMIEAGDRLYHFSPYEGEKTEVEAEPASETVQKILDIIPEQIGFRFTGLPDQPHLHPDGNFSWNINNPDILTSNHSDLTYPNEEYPEDQIMTVTNRKGDTLEYPYYEDEDGRQYFITAHKWWLQRNYAVGQVRNMASSDPLGAARLLYRFAERYEGYTPVSDHIWLNYPVEPLSGPPYPWWGGIWNRWSAAELSSLRSLFQAYEELKKTNAFEVLSEEVGEDVDRKIVEDMFKPSVEFARTYPIINHNMDYTKWTGLGDLSKAINDPSYIHEGVELLEDYTMNEYLFDGFYKETTLSYHNQSTDGINQAIDVFEGWSDPEGYISPRSGTRYDGLDMRNQFPALGKSQEIPEILVYPDGKYFPTQDTWANESSSNPNLEAGSFLLPASGIARFQRGLENDDGESLDEPSQLYMTFDPKYGHDHYDPLNLGLYAAGQELLPDIGYSYTFYRQWAASTMGHNTVVVDSSDMSRSGDAQHGGSIEVFAPLDDNLQVMRARQENAYSSTEEYSREPWFIGFPDGDGQGYVLDLFRVSGGDRHEYTLNGDANRDAVFETEMQLEEYGDYLLPEGTEVTLPETAYDTGDAEGHYYGYIYIQDVQQALLDNDQFELTLVTEEEGQKQAKMNIIGILDSGENELFVGQSPSLRSTRLYGRNMDTNDEAVKYYMPKLVLRRDGRDLTSQFITLMEPYQDEVGSRIDSVQQLEMDEFSEGDIAVAVTHGDTTDIILSSPHHPEKPLVVDDITMEGTMGMVRMQHGEVEDMYLIGGTHLIKGDVQLTDKGAVAGTITDVMRQANRDNYDAFVTDVHVPEEMKGNYIVVTHPDGKTHGYEVGEIISEDDQTIIRTEGMDPGFSINNNGSSAMDFYPFLQWEGEHTFRIENMVRNH